MSHQTRTLVYLTCDWCGFEDQVSSQTVAVNRGWQQFELRPFLVNISDREDVCPDCSNQTRIFRNRIKNAAVGYVR